MRKLLFFAGVITLVLATIVLALINLDFTINVEDKIYYPNETIDIEVSVINRDSFTAKDAVLMLYIEQRTFKFKLGDLKSYDTFTKTITLPEFPPSTHNIRGALNYSGIFEERFTLETYGSFEVRFPEVQRFPRNVNIVNFEVPEKIYGGKEYTIEVTVSNDGDVGGDLIVELAFMEETVSERLTLGAGESTTLSLTPKFSNTGVSLMEARVYALVDDIRYLLTYSGKEVFVQEEKIAKLSLGRVEVVDKENIRQNDEAKLKIYLQNTGSYSANEVKGSLTSSNSEIEVIDGTVDYTIISSGDSYASEEDTFVIKTKNADIQQYNLKLEVSYIDSEQRTVSFNVPLSVEEDRCESDAECASNEICMDNKCEELECGFCQYPKNNQCVNYECCSDSDCPNLYTCDTKLHICKAPECTQNAECADNEVCVSGKCKSAYTLVFVPINWQSDEAEGFKAKAQTAYIDFLSKTHCLALATQSVQWSSQLPTWQFFGLI